MMVPVHRQSLNRSFCTRICFFVICYFQKENSQRKSIFDLSLSFRGQGIMLHRSTIQLLRFHFSLFLLPVYLFALSQAPTIDLKNAVLSFFILHLLVYPSSNG